MCHTRLMTYLLTGEGATERDRKKMTGREGELERDCGPCLSHEKSPP